jgi:hypothetical protein
LLTFIVFPWIRNGNEILDYPHETIEIEILVWFPLKFLEPIVKLAISLVGNRLSKNGDGDAWSRSYEIFLRVTWRFQGETIYLI